MEFVVSFFFLCIYVQLYMMSRYCYTGGAKKVLHILRKEKNCNSVYIFLAPLYLLHDSYYVVFKITHTHNDMLGKTSGPI
jgi:hypothetical protein